MLREKEATAGIETASVSRNRRRRTKIEYMELDISPEIVYNLTDAGNRIL